MKVERQGPEECMLSTVAALAGKSLVEIRKEACQAAGVTRWVDSLAPGQTFRYWDGVDHLLSHYGLKGLIPRWHSDLHPPSTTSLLRPSLPKCGRGSIMVELGGRRPLNHIAPWENGRVYDPNDPKVGRTLPEYLKFLASWDNQDVNILSITCDKPVIDKKSRKV
jgi:hypothetical protein